ncbi:MAG: hypothetical protein ACK4V6_06755 [Microthrixaceae bacterium]
MRDRSARARGPQRTYGIGGFIAAFVGIAVVGLVALIVLGAGGGGTEQLSTPQTIEEGWDGVAATTDGADGEPSGTDPSAGAGPDADASSSEVGGAGSSSSDSAGSSAPRDDTSAPSASSEGSGTRVTLPDGSLAPDGVAEVLVEGELTSYVLTPPPTADPSRMEPVVAPMGLAQFDGGSEVRLTIGCARSSEEFLAQVAVTEAADTITFVAIALAPRGGAPCEPGATPIELFLPLRAPVGDRTIVVVPPDAPVPALDTA